MPTPQPQAQAPKLLPPAPRNKKVIPIIDPKTNRNVLDDLMTHQPPQHQIQQQAPRQVKNKLVKWKRRHITISVVT